MPRSPPSRRIMAIWLCRLALDRWRHAHGCAPGEGVDALPTALITETAHGPRISAANAAGRAAGAAAGMMLADARTLCPQIKAVAGDPAGDLAFLERLALWARRWGPWAALDPPDGLIVDITGIAHLFGGERGLVDDVAMRFAGWGGSKHREGHGLAVGGLEARCAIAPTAGAAWALAHFGPPGTVLGDASGGDATGGDRHRGGMPGGGVQSSPIRQHPLRQDSVRRDSVWQESVRDDAIRVRKARDDKIRGAGAGGDIMRALSALPVAALRLDEDVLRVLRRLGLKRLGDLSGIGRDALQRRFRNRHSPAANPLIRLDQLTGRVPEPLLPVIQRAAPLVQRRLMEPIRHRDPLDTVLGDLAADMARMLEGLGEGARRLELHLWRVDGEVLTRRLELAAATRDASHICRLFAAKLDGLDAGFGIEMVRLVATWTEPLGLAQSDLEAAAEEHGTSLAACIDRLIVRLGEQAVRRPVPFASHLPERAQRWQPPLAGEPAELAGEGTGTPARPLKLLDTPERIAVLYATPDGHPRQIRWRGRIHDVARVEGPERIAPEWWRERGTARLRDYYRIEDSAGRRYWIYRAGLTGDGRGGAPDWFLHGLCA